MNRQKRILVFIIMLVLTVVPLIPTSSAAFTGDDKIVVVLDPGHGGKDPGAAGIRSEAYYNLEVALAAKAKLEANGNFVVHMTRSTSDKYLTLAERLYFADTVNADVVISIHFNSSTSSSMGGVEVYGSVLDRFYLGTLGQKISSKVASAAGINNRGVFRKYDYGSTLYYWSEEYQWDIPGDSSVGGLSDYYGVITWGAKFGIPSLIIEHAYLSNYNERNLIENPAVLKAMGEADADALIEYYTNHSHSYGSEIIDAPVTCFSAGKKSVHCTVCGHRKNVTTVAAAPDSSKHIWLTDGNATAATCENDGYAKYYCRYTFNLNDKGCTQFQVHRTEAVTPAYGHDYQVTYHRDVTHTVDGITTYTCSRCAGSYNETVAAKGHSYSLTAHTDPDCVNQGSDTYTCSECNESYSNPIPALGHDYNVIERIDPTCESDGSEHHICKVCNFEETETIAALGHDFIIYSDIMPNCTEEGLRVTVCTVCEKMEEEVKSKAGHNFSVIAEIKATCTEKGELKQQCIVCQLEETVITDPSGHDYRTGEKTPPHCTEVISRKAFCNACGDEGEEIVQPAGHLFDEGVIADEPGLFFDGNMKLSCSVCSYTELSTIRDLTIFEYIDTHPLRFYIMCAGAGISFIGAIVAVILIIKKKKHRPAHAKPKGESAEGEAESDTAVAETAIVEEPEKESETIETK